MHVVVKYHHLFCWLHNRLLIRSTLERVSHRKESFFTTSMLVSHAPSLIRWRMAIQIASRFFFCTMKNPFVCLIYVPESSSILCSLFDVCFYFKQQSFSRFTGHFCAMRQLDKQLNCNSEKGVSTFAHTFFSRIQCRKRTFRLFSWDVSFPRMGSFSR